jgi:acetyltransferase-like isoleucine patch superfamily enzyme
MFDPGYYTENDLRDAGFRSLGKNIAIAKNCTIIGIPNISIGNNVRIDGFTTISAAGTGFLELGSNVHIASYCMLIAGAGIKMHDFSAISQGVKIYSKSDNYSGLYLTGPTVPTEFSGVIQGTVELHKHVIIGSSSVILPDVIIGEGVAVGALSFVTKNLDPWGIYVGTPVKKIKSRCKKLLEFEQAFMSMH